MEEVTLDASAFAVKTAVFEGPMELLLELVEKRKLLINDISLATVTDEYMREVSLMQEQSLPNTAQFIALAATLLLIKSKSLLPILDLTPEEEESIDDLEERLKLYKIYRDAAAHVEERFGKQVMHSRQFIASTEPIFTTDKFTEAGVLQQAIWDVISSLPKKEIKPRVQVRPVISLEEMIDRLHKRIENQLKLRFSELVGTEREHKTVIVGFLAVLESVKQGSILVAQAQRFDEIHIEKEKTGAPRYY